MLQFADWFFTIFHALLILFNLFGWIPKNSRKIHLAVISITFLSWFGLGIWYGWGYCPLTDWHWQILRESGKTGLPDSYVNFLLMRFFDLRLPVLWVDGLTVGAATAALIASVKVNFFGEK